MQSEQVQRARIKTLNGP